jgi:hypothetical protein
VHLSNGDFTPIRKSRLSHRITVFAWLLTLDRLNTREKLAHKNIIDDDCCPLCVGTTEDRAHLFLSLSRSLFLFLSPIAGQRHRRPYRSETSKCTASPTTFYTIGDDSLAHRALRTFLGIGNAMGLQFEQDAWDAGVLSAPISKTFPAYQLTASIHLSDIHFDEILMAVLLQACIGGSADMFRVQKITSYCFRFFVPSVESMKLLLRQPSIKAKRFTLVFDYIDDAPAGDANTCQISRFAASDNEAVKETCINTLAMSSSCSLPSFFTLIDFRVMMSKK